MPSAPRATRRLHTTRMGVSTARGRKSSVSGRHLVAPAAAAALVLAAALPAGAQAPPKTVTFREVAKGTTFSYVDNPPRGKSRERPRFSPGDAFVLNIPLINDRGVRRGALRAMCPVTGRSNDPNRAPALCSGVVTLKEGQLVIVLSTTNLDAKITTGAVVGGTRAYSWARGTFSSVTSKAGVRDTVTLLD